MARRKSAGVCFSLFTGASVESRSSGLPAVQEFGEGRRTHVAHVLELAGLLRIEQLAMLVQHRQRRHSLVQRDTVGPGDIRILVKVSDIDVDDDEMLRQQLLVWALMHIDIEHLTVAAPVSAKVQYDA